MATIVDGKKISIEILAEVREELLAMRVKPKLFAVLVGEDPASISFLNEKRKKCEEVGITFQLNRYPVDITTSQLRKAIHALRQKRGAKSIIVQLPLPAHLNTQYILDAVPPEEDADMLSSRSRGLLATEKAKVLPPTAAAILRVLEVHGFMEKGADGRTSLASMHCVILGLGTLVGKPLLQLLADKVSSVTACHAGTPDIAKFTKDADLVISGVGKPGLVAGGMVRDGVVALDAGYSRMGGKVAGDMDFEGVAGKASLITPVPGGIGPVTVAMLIKNIVTLASS